MPGSKPGERRGGRKKGTRNKATVEVKAIAQKYTKQVIERLAYLSLKAESEQAQVAACKELLDRGHGKAPQHISTDGPQVPLFAIGVMPSVSKERGE
jgi:hypothetical protein